MLTVITTLSAKIRPLKADSLVCLRAANHIKDDAKLLHRSLRIIGAKPSLRFPSSNPVACSVFNVEPSRFARLKARFAQSQFNRIAAGPVRNANLKDTIAVILEFELVTGLALLRDAIQEGCLAIKGQFGYLRLLDGIEGSIWVGNGAIRICLLGNRTTQ